MARINLAGLDDPATLVNLALVVVALSTVIVTSWQNRKSQQLIAKQTQVMAGQTDLQQKQFSEILKEQERPRISELIRKVLTTAINLIDSNDQVRTEPGGFLIEGNIVHNYLVGSSDEATRLAFDGFKREYPELATKIKSYDELSIDLRNMKQKLEEVLKVGVEMVIPKAVKAIPPDWIAGGMPEVDARKIIQPGIFLGLQGKTPSLTMSKRKASYLVGIEDMLWEKADKMFLALAEEPEAKKLIGELRELAQRSYDMGIKLSGELGILREALGGKYKIPRRDYFPSPPPIALTS